MRRRHPAFIVLLAAMWLPSVALAQSAAPADPATDARSHFETARALFEHENFDQALTEFQRVYELMEASPRRYIVLFNIAQCHERMFRYDEALRFYQRYLDEGGSAAEDRVTIEATMHALEGLLATIDVRSNVPRAEVWIDERRIGTAPGTLRIPGGRHVVQLRAPGYVPAQQEVQLPARATRQLTFALEAVRTRQGIGLYWSVGAGIGALACVIAGASFGTEALAMRSNDMMRVSQNDFTVGPDDQRAIRNVALTADVFFASAVVLGAATVILYLMSERHHAHPDAAPTHAMRMPVLQPTIAPNAAGVGLTWSM